MITRIPVDSGLATRFGPYTPSSYRTASLSLPVTEATADANTFVCEFTGGAGANETGVGGGLTGVDLVLTQVGSIPAASGGFRTLNGTTQYFTCTANALVTMLNGTEWTIMWRVKNWSNVDMRYLCDLRDGTLNNGFIAINKATTTSYLDATVSNKRELYTAVGGGPTVSAALDGWFAMWRKNSNVHYGFLSGSVAPTGWESLPQSQRFVVVNHGDFSADTWATRQHIVGSSTGYPALDIGGLVISKYGLPGAPV